MYLESHSFYTFVDLIGIEARKIIENQKIDLVLLDFTTVHGFGYKFK
ncbi:hypothetical protein F3D3_0427 [Fusibacter sp. 3D3]|nr:hypothetical protein F3D3_0427 [Fusibacter sp. 3D3]